MNVPAARVELAIRGDDPGIISARISSQELTLGNEILERIIPGYDASRRHGVDEYTLEAINEAFRELQVRPPAGSESDKTAQGVFAEYLVLDCVVANTDRHHENWGILRDPYTSEAPELAPSFDHASSLGFQLSDDRRLEILDRNAVANYCRRGRSRHFKDRPTLMALALNAIGTLGQEVLAASSKWQETPLPDLAEDIISQVPEHRMSQPARTLATAIIRENHRRLIYGFAKGS